MVDWISTAIEKAGDADSSVNAATATLVGCIRGQIEAGQNIHIIGHSAGSLCIQNAAKAVAKSYRNKSEGEQKVLLSRIHVLTIGGATFAKENALADRWPPLGSIHLVNDNYSSPLMTIKIPHSASLGTCV